MDVFHVLQQAQNPGDEQFVDKSKIPGTQSTQMQHLPLWLISVYVLSNVSLNALNFIWFGKMIQTIRDRNKDSVKKE